MKRALVVFGLLALSAVNVAGGYALARWMDPGLSSAMTLSNPDDAGAKAEYWLYPDSQRGVFAKEGDVSTRTLFFTGPTAAGYSTGASFEQVVDFYEVRFGRTTVEFVNDDLRPALCTLLDDSRKPTGGPRTVQLRVFSRKTVDYRVVAVVSRAEGDENTHVVLVHQ